MAISRRAAPLDLGVALPGEEGRRSLGGLLRRWLPIAIGLLMATAMILLAAAAPLIAPLSPSAQYADAVLKGPGAVERHLLGTDEFGRDVLSRIIWGARVSLQVGLASVAWGFLLGVPLGILAGTRGGMVETAIMARHVFPNALYALVVVATLYIATAIRTEASLSFLGLGIPPPTPSWGNILSEGRQYIKCCPWITTFSGVAIMLAVLAFNLVGDALRDLLDPRLRGE